MNIDQWPRIALTLPLLVLMACNRQPPAPAHQDAGPVAVRVAPVTVRQMQREVESVGTLFPYDEAIISAEVEGRAEEVLVDLGDRVVPGQPMVRIADEEQRYLLAQNEAQLRQSLQRLGLKSDKERVKDIRDTPEVRRAQADLTDAEQRLGRTRRLVDQSVGSQQDLDQADARYKASLAAYDSIVISTRNLIQEVERFKAVVDLQRKKLRDTNVRAPFAGSVKERQVTVGQYLRANTPLLTLVKIDPIRLRIEIPERMAPWVKIGQMAKVTVEAFQDREFQGKIWRISPTVDQSKRTFIVEALINNASGELKPGSYAKARVATDHIERINLIPTRAVSYVFGSNKAFVVQGGTVEARELKLGDRFGEEVEVTEGLKEGETVAVTQVNRLDTGTKVRVVTGEAKGADAKRPG
jgi:RND family efflux transporter MFP subunit